MSKFEMTGELRVLQGSWGERILNEIAEEGARAVIDRAYSFQLYLKSARAMLFDLSQSWSTVQRFFALG